MSLNLVSPGVKVREVDLTVGRIDAVNDQVGVIAGPFARGPIGEPVLVETEQDLLNTFGKHRKAMPVRVLDDCILLLVVWWNTKGYQN